MLLPWQLWRRVLNPPRQHPIFQRSAAQPGPRISPFMQVLWLVTLGIGLLLLLAIAPAAVFLVVVALAITLPVFFLISHSWIYGAYWSLHTASSIARERSANTYALLHLAPEGPDHADWLIALGCLHRGNTVLLLHRLVKIVVITLLLALTVAMTLGLGAVSGIVQDVEGETQVLGVVLPLIVGCAILYLEHSLAIVSAALLGILSGRRANSDVEARILALLLFLGSQALLYTVWLLGSRGSAMLLALHSEAMSLIAAPFVGLMIYLVLRTTLIQILWTLFRHNTPQ